MGGVSVICFAYYFWNVEELSKLAETDSLSLSEQLCHLRFSVKMAMFLRGLNPASCTGTVGGSEHRQLPFK